MTIRNCHVGEIANSNRPFKNKKMSRQTCTGCVGVMELIFISAGRPMSYVASAHNTSLFVTLLFLMCLSSFLIYSQPTL